MVNLIVSTKQWFGKLRQPQIFEEMFDRGGADFGFYG